MRHITGRGTISNYQGTTLASRNENSDAASGKIFGGSRCIYRSKQELKKYFS